MNNNEGILPTGWPERTAVLSQGNCWRMRSGHRKWAGQEEEEGGGERCVHSPSQSDCMRVTRSCGS